LALLELTTELFPPPALAILGLQSFAPKSSAERSGYAAVPAEDFLLSHGNCGFLRDVRGCGYPFGMTQATKAAKSTAKQRRAAAERTRGMFAHLAPGVSMADELIAERRAEAQAEERADAQRRRA
jgi:hypothetical protein